MEIDKSRSLDDILEQKFYQIKGAGIDPAEHFKTTIYYDSQEGWYRDKVYFYIEPAETQKFLMEKRGYLNVESSTTYDGFHWYDYILLIPLLIKSVYHKGAIEGANSLEKKINQKQVTFSETKIHPFEIVISLHSVGVDEFKNRLDFYLEHIYNEFRGDFHPIFDTEEKFKGSIREVKETYG